MVGDKDGLVILKAESLHAGLGGADHFCAVGILVRVP